MNEKKVKRMNPCNRLPGASRTKAFVFLPISIFDYQLRHNYRLCVDQKLKSVIPDLDQLRKLKSFQSDDSETLLEVAGIETDGAEAATLSLPDLDLRRISQGSQGEEVIRFPRQRAGERANRKADQPFKQSPLGCTLECFWRIYTRTHRPRRSAN